jgi:pseudaminic acid biosynthesis-associated methylase
MHTTEQESFWAGEFGNDYIERNQGAKLLASNLNFFTKALNQTRGLSSCMEFGANIGMNLKALSLLYPSIDLKAVEINENAAAELANVIPKDSIQTCSIFDADVSSQVDLSLIKGVLIHINPEYLETVYNKLYSASKKYILIAEYYNPSPVAIPYRGHSDRLFKRDFAGEFMELFPDVELVDYGFAYKNDPVFPQDDITWFLIKKK